MKFVLLIMWKPTKLSRKLVLNQVVSLNFEEVIAKELKISMFSSILNNFRKNHHFLMFLGSFQSYDSTQSQ